MKQNGRDGGMKHGGHKRSTHRSSFPSSSSTQSGSRSSGFSGYGSSTDMKKYICQACSYIYDPAEGDPEHYLEPGIPFESLPYDWTCPTCHVGRDAFRPEDY